MRSWTSARLPHTAARPSADRITSPRLSPARLAGDSGSTPCTSGGSTKGTVRSTAAPSRSTRTGIGAAAGLISDKVGRRPMLLVGSAGLVVLVIPAFLLITSGNVWVALLGQLIYVLPLRVYSAGSATIFVEIFQTKTRFTSAAVSYNVGYALLGGTAPLVGTCTINQSDFSIGSMFGSFLGAISLLAIVNFFRRRRGDSVHT